MKPVAHTKGQKLTIYQDPVTKQMPEGEATLVEFVSKDDYPPYREDWKVLFDGEGEFAVIRSIIED